MPSLIVLYVFFHSSTEELLSIEKGVGDSLSLYLSFQHKTLKCLPALNFPHFPCATRHALKDMMDLAHQVIQRWGRTVLCGIWRVSLGSLLVWNPWRSYKAQEQYKAGSSLLFHHPPIPGAADHQIRRFNGICTCYRGHRAAEALQHCTAKVWASVSQPGRVWGKTMCMRLVSSAQAQGGPSSELGSPAQALTAAG